jgi:tight adherence protein B
MTMFLIAFALVFLLTSGTALLGALMVSRKARRAVERRFNLVVRTPTESPRGTSLVPSSVWVRKAEESLSRLFILGISRRWAMHINSSKPILIAFGASAAVWLLVRVAFGFSYWFVAPLMASAFLLAPRLWLRHQQVKADKQFMSVFPDAIDMVVRMLRAGLPITSAIRSIGREASPPVDMVFAMLNEQVEIGIPLDVALEAVGKRIGLPDFRFFAVAVSLQSTTGGNLASTLEILTDIMRKRRAVRLKAQSATAEVRLSAYVLGALPFFVIAVLLISDPAYLIPLVQDPRGNIIVAVASLLLLIAFFSMRQMMRSITASGS